MLMAESWQRIEFRMARGKEKSSKLHLTSLEITSNVLLSFKLVSTFNGETENGYFIPSSTIFFFFHLLCNSFFRFSQFVCNLCCLNREKMPYSKRLTSSKTSKDFYCEKKMEEKKEICHKE